VELSRHGETLSTLDLLVGQFVLLAGPDGDAWAASAEAAGAVLGVTVRSYRIDRAATRGELVDLHGDVSTPFWTTYGIGPSGASLVRPDGYVAWRAESQTADAGHRLTAALRQVLCR
jgi:hypothetical protein